MVFEVGHTIYFNDLVILSDQSVLPRWVEAPGFGGGGSDWVERHIESFVNIAGTMLGVPKASAALLSGEVRANRIILSVAEAN